LPIVKRTGSRPQAPAAFPLVKRHAKGVFHAQGVNLQIRVGLNSGEVVVRAISSELHMDYSATHSPHPEDWLVLECGAVSYGKAMSYLPMINLLRSYFEIQDKDDLQTIGDKVAGKLLTLDDALEPTLPALLTLLDVPVADAAWQTLDPARRRRHMLDAVRHLLLRQAREQLLLLIVEDLHWIDGETQALLEDLVGSLASARMLLLAGKSEQTCEHLTGATTMYLRLICVSIWSRRRRRRQAADIAAISAHYDFQSH
jgi:hypothetical protein